MANKDTKLPPHLLTPDEYECLAGIMLRVEQNRIALNLSILNEIGRYREDTEQSTSPLAGGFQNGSVNYG